jgi:hypothetical protein
MNVRLRDHIITKEDWIFSVVSYDDRMGIESLLRYIPDEDGERIRRGKRYLKLDFDESYKFLRENRPEYVKRAHLVPKEDVKEVLHPNEVLYTLKDEKVQRIVDCLRGIPLQNMGVTGSYLCGLQLESSDIDFVVYGRDWFTARGMIDDAKGDGLISPVSEEMWRSIYKKRKPELKFDEFLMHEKRKGNRGIIDGTYFDLLYVRDWEEIEKEEKRGEIVGSAKIVAPVTEVIFPFDCPAIYRVEDEYIDLVLSFSHTYIGQALPGEIIEAKGKVEECGDERRLIVGTTRDARGEWLKSLTLLEL